jgi:hypothetical protein
MAETAFEAAIAEIDRQIEELQRAKESLMRLTVRAIGDAPLPAASNSHATTFTGDAMLAVREQEFAGMSIAKAAEAFLRKIGRHEKTTVIIQAIGKGGVDVGGKNPVSTVYTTLARRPAFVSLGKNYWDLAVRRPDLQPGKRPVEPRRKVRRVRRPRTATTATETTA